MTWHWTAQDCLAQLACIGVRLSVGANGKLIVDAPADLEMTDSMLRVIRKYKSGLMTILSDINVDVTNDEYV